MVLTYSTGTFFGARALSLCSTRKGSLYQQMLIGYIKLSKIIVDLSRLNRKFKTFVRLDLDTETYTKNTFGDKTVSTP